MKRRGAAVRRVARATCALTLLVAASRARAADPAVFQGDPVNAANKNAPWIVLPGLPLVDWGPDKKWRTADDVINNAIVGDVDVVVRTGGTYTAGSGVIPAPAQGVAAASEIVAGGLNLTATGDEVPYQIILSDGAASPAAGNPLGGTDLDARGTLVVAFPDLDGDGVIGPTSADGAADNAIELQETVQLAGRRMSTLQSGVASGALAVSLGAPASAGGLGLVVAAGAITGSKLPLYDDAGWVATRLPLMWPIDPKQIIGGGNARPPTPFSLVDIEVEAGRTFLPAPTHPVLGGAYAIPLDGSSISNDLLRAVSGPAEAGAFALAVNPATFVANPLRVLRPLIKPNGGRVVVEATDTLTVRDDGPGRGATVLLYPADRLGNAADPPAAGVTVDLEAGTGLRIAAPDTDGDPAHESIHFTSSAYAAIVLDDDGDARDDGPTSTLVAVTDGAASAALRVAITAPGAASPRPLDGGSASLIRGSEHDRLTMAAQFVATPGSVDLATQDLTIALRTADGSVYQRTVPAGALVAKAGGARFRFHDPVMVANRIAALVVRRDAGNPNLYRVRLRARGLDFAAAPPGTTSIDARVVAGEARFRSPLSCTAGSSANITACVR